MHSFQGKQGVFCLGFFTAAAQIILIREFMGALGGSELVLIFILVGWLTAMAWGAGSPSRGHCGPGAISRLFLLAGLGLLLAFAASRLVRPALGLSPGQMIDPLIAGGLSAACVLPLSFIYGRIFTGMSGACRALDAGRLYGIEALGFAAGSVVVTGFLWASVPVIVILGLLVWMHFLVSFWSLDRKSYRKGLFLAIGIVFSGGILFWGDPILLRAQWPGFDVLESRDSVLGRWTVLRQAGQVSLFENGLLTYTDGDQAASEESVHYALLARELPQEILLIGGGPGAIAEALKHPGVRVDYNEMDPWAIRLIQRHFHSAQDIFSDPRVRILPGDGRRIVKERTGAYDAILFNVADPVTLVLNRYYTREFFEETARALRSGGVLSLTVSGAENALNRETRAFLRLMMTTLRSVFSDVQVIPGDRVIFLASLALDRIRIDPGILEERLLARRLQTKYVQPYYFTDRLSPLRRARMSSLVSVPGEVNQDDRPAGFICALVSGTTHFGTAFSRGMAFVSHPLAVGGGVCLCVFLPVLLFCLSSGGIFSAAIFSAGFTHMLAQAVILLRFQSYYGYLLSWLGLLMAAFMLGLWGGTRGGDGNGQPGKGLGWIPLGGVILFVSLSVLLGPEIQKCPPGIGMAGFLAAAFFVGMLGGRMFSGAVVLGKDAGRLYAVDVLGSALGALAGGLVFLPFWGGQGSLVACAAIWGVIGILSVIRRGGRPARKNALL